VVLKPDTNVFDMRTTQCTYGSPEQNLGKMAMVQLARFYDIPIYGLGGGVEAKSPDAEAASEAALNMLLNAQAGMTMSQSLGTLAWGMYGSQEMVVICDQIVDVIRRVMDRIAIDDATLAVEVIREVGPGGNFLNHDHTVQHFRQELFFPRLFARQTSDTWVKAGSQRIDQVAHQRVQSILDKAGPVDLSPGADAELERALRKAVEETRRKT
jgi:trimethylamine--corrinoid protein Co-methyltransferase